jgi:hypothetical protein
MAKSKKKVKAEAPALSLEELVKQKIAAGLTKDQATRVAQAQLDRDAQLAESDESEEEETNPPAA